MVGAGAQGAPVCQVFGDVHRVHEGHVPQDEEAGGVDHGLEAQLERRDHGGLSSVWEGLALVGELSGRVCVRSASRYVREKSDVDGFW